MTNADLHVLLDSLRFVENKVRRDYFELSNLQSASSGVRFLEKTREWLNEKFHNFFREKRPDYVLTIGDTNFDSNSIAFEAVLEQSIQKIGKQPLKKHLFIDSLVGAKNLLHGIPYFATAMLLEIDGKATAAVVSNYATNDTFYCVSGMGSFRNERRLRVSSRNSLEQALVGFGYGKLRNGGNIGENKNRKSVDGNTENDVKKEFENKIREDTDVLSKIFRSLPTVRFGNCSLLDSCYTACGGYEGNLIMNISENELKISKLLVGEAGGLCYKIADNGYIFTNSVLGDDLVNIVNSWGILG